MKGRGTGGAFDKTPGAFRGRGSNEVTGGERGSPRFAPDKRGGGRGEALTQVRGHSGGGASINCPGLKGDFQGCPRLPRSYLAYFPTM